MSKTQLLAFSSTQDHVNPSRPYSKGYTVPSYIHYKMLLLLLKSLHGLGPTYYLSSFSHTHLQTHLDFLTFTCLPSYRFTSAPWESFQSFLHLHACPFIQSKLHLFHSALANTQWLLHSVLLRPGLLSLLGFILEFYIHTSIFISLCLPLLQTNIFYIPVFTFVLLATMTVWFSFHWYHEMYF